MIIRSEDEKAQILGKQAFTLQDSIRKRASAAEVFRGYLIGVLEDRVWEKPRMSSSGKTWPPCSFYDFVHGTGSADLNSSYEQIEDLIREQPDNDKLSRAWEGVTGRQVTSAEVLLSAEDIRRDGGTQSRAELNQEVIADYAEHVDDLPPSLVFFDGESYWLVDGFHRVAAHEKAGRSDVRCEVRQGTRRDAVLESVGVNAKHGLRRTNADKRRAVETLLRDEEWRTKRKAWIAAKAGVSDRTVARIMNEFRQCQNSPAFPEKVEGKDGKLYPASKPRKTTAPTNHSADEQSASSDLAPTASSEPGAQLSVLDRAQAAVNPPEPSTSKPNWYVDKLVAKVSELSPPGRAEFFRRVEQLRLDALAYEATGGIP